MKLTIHLPARLEPVIEQVWKLPEVSLLSDSKFALFVFEKGIDRLRDEARIAPDRQVVMKFSKHPLAGKKIPKKGRKK